MVNPNNLMLKVTVDFVILSFHQTLPITTILVMPIFLIFSMSGYDVP